MINICSRFANFLALFLDICSVQFSHSVTSDSLQPCGHLLLVCVLNDILILLCISVEKKCKYFFILMFYTELAVFTYISDNLIKSSTILCFPFNIYVVAVVQSLSHVCSLQSHGLQHTRYLCLSLSPGIRSHSCWLSQWYYLILCHPILLLPSDFPSISLFQWVSSLNQGTKVLELRLQHQLFQWIFRVDFL